MSDFADELVGSRGPAGAGGLPGMPRGRLLEKGLGRVHGGEKRFQLRFQFRIAAALRFQEGGPVFGGTLPRGDEEPADLCPAFGRHAADNSR